MTNEVPSRKRVYKNVFISGYRYNINIIYIYIFVDCQLESGQDDDVELEESSMQDKLRVKRGSKRYLDTDGGNPDKKIVKITKILKSAKRAGKKYRAAKKANKRQIVRKTVIKKKGRKNSKKEKSRRKKINKKNKVAANQNKTIITTIEETKGNNNNGSAVTEPGIIKKTVETKVQSEKPTEVTEATETVKDDEPEKIVKKFIVVNNPEEGTTDKDDKDDEEEIMDDDDNDDDDDDSDDADDVDDTDDADDTDDNDDEADVVTEVVVDDENENENDEKEIKTEAKPLAKIVRKVINMAKKKKAKTAKRKSLKKVVAKFVNQKKEEKITRQNIKADKKLSASLHSLKHVIEQTNKHINETEAQVNNTPVATVVVTENILDNELLKSIHNLNEELDSEKKRNYTTAPSESTQAPSQTTTAAAQIQQPTQSNQTTTAPQNPTTIVETNVVQKVTSEAKVAEIPTTSKLMSEDSDEEHDHEHNEKGDDDDKNVKKGHDEEHKTDHKIHGKQTLTNESVEEIANAAAIKTSALLQNRSLNPHTIVIKPINQYLKTPEQVKTVIGEATEVNPVVPNAKKPKTSVDIDVDNGQQDIKRHWVVTPAPKVTDNQEVAEAITEKIDSPVAEIQKEELVNSISEKDAATVVGKTDSDAGTTPDAPKVDFSINVQDDKDKLVHLEGHDLKMSHQNKDSSSGLNALQINAKIDEDEGTKGVTEKTRMLINTIK